MDRLESQPRRHPPDWLQVGAVVCVAALLIGEVALLARVFQQHRSRRMPVEASDLVYVTPPAVPSNAVAAVNRPPIVPRQTVAAPEQPVLNPALKIQRIQRADTPQGVSFQVRLRAQTGEREFDASAARVSVEWLLADGAKRLEWLALPVGWENFAVQTVAARCDAPPGQLRGYVVRTFYRQHLQDMVTASMSTP